MSKFFPRPLVLAAIVVAMSGCSLFGKGKMHERYLDAESGKALEVPAELDTPARRDSHVSSRTLRQGAGGVGAGADRHARRDGTK